MICGSRHIFNRMRTDSFTVCAFKSQSFKKPQNLIPFLESIASKIQKTSFGKNILQKNVALKKITEIKIEPTNELWAEATLAVSRNLDAPFSSFSSNCWIVLVASVVTEMREREWVRVCVWVCVRERNNGKTSPSTSCFRRECEKNCPFKFRTKRRRRHQRRRRRRRRQRTCQREI